MAGPAQWAVELALDLDEAKANAGLEALHAMTETTQGLDDEELNFLARITDLFLVEDESGTLEPDLEDNDDDPHV